MDHWRPPSRPQPAPLQGSRVLLRPIDPETDAQALHAQSHPPAAPPQLWAYLPYGPFADPQAMRTHLESQAASQDPLFFALVRLPEQRPAGVAAYLRITPAHGVIEIGHIWFGASLRRTPAATEAIYLLAAHAFDGLGYRRVEWKCNALNQASRRAAQRFGFTLEGVFRHHMVVKGHNRDTAWFAITDDEWPALRRGFEAWLAPDNFDADGTQRRALSAVRGAQRG